MAEATSKRRREKYSRLICLGCRSRRIRCVLPDIPIVPSSEPQEPDKACQRCAQNGLDCVVDYTTLGRPAQKRNRAEPTSTQPTGQPDSEEQTTLEFEDDVSHDVGDFLLSQQGTDTDAIFDSKPTRSEMIEASFSPFNLLPALLARDKQFASAIGSQPLVGGSVIEMIDETTMALLDQHLMWHRLYYPDIPSLTALRTEVKSLERGRSERPSALFLLTLLCDLALDVPSVRLASHRILQPAVRALLFHTGQQVLVTLSRTDWTILALVLAAQYRPLVFTSSQTAAAPAIRAVSYCLLAKQVCVELGYDTAAGRLTEALHGFETDNELLKKLMYQCLHWIRLSIAHDMVSNMLVHRAFQFRNAVASTYESVEALTTASVLGRLPHELLLPYNSTCGLCQMLLSLSELSEVWKDLGKLGDLIDSHKAHTVREKESIQNAIDVQQCSPELGHAIMHLSGADLDIYHHGVKGCALFFAVMSGAHAASSQLHVQPDQAMGITNDIIQQLLAHEADDPNRPSHRKFLEKYGHTRIDELELDLANCVTTVDTLTLNGIPFVGPLREWTGMMIYTTKDIVEQQAARLKGCGGLHDRIDVQMILFLQLARSLEAMSATAGTPEALSKGCILTATAKLIRSLHRVLQGFKKTAMMNQRRTTSISGSSKQGVTPGSGTTAITTEVLPTASASNVGGGDFLSEDLFANWENWPQSDPSDFSDLFGDAFGWEPQEGL